ncbi:MAG TPA: iron-containing alcohol dehydrogenase, partial [Methylophilaceae bacterium]|nr:iron-containing alcohol dehydrogenase [Methylophilaceae bacterium]
MMQIPAFSITGLPRIIFGNGSARQIPSLASEFGRKALIMTGAHAFINSLHWQALQQDLRSAGIAYEHATVSGEPSPALVDEIAARFQAAEIEVVIGIGGGSVLDAAKAVAGLLRIENSVMDFLEGVGPELPYPGPEVPFIAVPTTAGTGSEATKNAVLSKQGEGGYKKSFRHDRLVANYAVVDPELLATCPQA